MSFLAGRAGALDSIEKGVFRCYSYPMSKKLVIFIVMLVAGLLFGGYTLISSRSSRVSGLKIVSVPNASIFLNEKLIGKTPYEDKQPPGEYVLKLIADDPSVVSWQGKVLLYPSLLTYVKRELGSSELTSAGDMLTLERLTGTEAQIAIISSPDAATVVIDGQEKGSTPYIARDILVGEHDVAVSSPGFAQRSVRVQATSGYKLTANFQLALVGAPPIIASDSATPHTTPSISTTPTPNTSGSTGSVMIKDTPTGFLRVRNAPSTSGAEVAQVKPGDKYPLTDEKDGWYKIAYESGKEGWISSKYAAKQ